MKNRILVAILPVLACFALLPGAQALNPDGCYPGFTTAEGCQALFSLTTGQGNTGLGWRALFLDTTGNFNTGVGGGALVLNNADSNTAVGAAAGLLNTSGTLNVAIGTDAMVFNDSGSNNTAAGAFALEENVAGVTNAAFGVFAAENNTSDFNAAIGGFALRANVGGTRNTAVGAGAMESGDAGDDNTAVGELAGNNITGNSNTCLGSGAGSNATSAEAGIYIGAQVQAGTVDEQEFIRIGSDTAFAFPYDTFIAGIFDRDVAAASAILVFVDNTGKLGTNLVDAAGNRVPFKPQAMLDESLKQQKRIAELEGTVERLTAQLKEQATQIQKVSAQLEMSKPAAKLVVNKP